MILRKKFWRVILILFIVLIGIISIIFIFHSFKVKPSSNPNFQEPQNKGATQTDKEKKQEVDSKIADNFDYQPIQPTEKEPEYQGKLLPVSSAGAELKKKFPRIIGSSQGPIFGRCFDCGVEEAVEVIAYIRCETCGEKNKGDGKKRCLECNNKKFRHDCSQQKTNMLPCGSALLTGSGDLEKQGIKAIVHACPGSLEKADKEEFQPTIQGIIRSVQNSILLAERHNYKSIAFCLIGSSMLDSIIPPSQGTKKERQVKLAEVIIRAAIEQSKKLKKAYFIDFGNEAFLKSRRNLEKEIEKKFPENGAISGNVAITDYSCHQCEVIVNSLNIEGEFINSGSFSGFIAKKTGSGKNQIQKEIREYISEFNKRLKK